MNETRNPRTWKKAAIRRILLNLQITIKINMKKSIILTAAICSVFALACAKVDTEGTNEANKRYLDAWIEVYHPDWKPVGLGYYVDPDYEVEGTGKEVKDCNYIFLNYTLTDLEGNIQSSTREDINRKIGNHDDSESPFYGPQIFRLDSVTMPVGVEEALKAMKVGGRKRLLLPSWLNTTDRYTNSEDYFNLVSGNDDIFYEFTCEDATNDITQYQIEQIKDYIGPRYGMAESDSLFKGFYKIILKEGSDSTSLPADTTIYINYTGRRLDGQVFDSTIKDTAKVNGIYSSSRDYEPTSFSVKEDFTESTMGSSESTTITGFSYGISTMKPMEKAAFIFISDYGYKYEGSSPAIPSYAPLEFVIELVEKPQ